MVRKYSEPGKRKFERPSERPSERMFRRSRAAENRRIKSSNKDARFFRFVYSLATIGIFVVFIIIVLMSKAAFAQKNVQDVAQDLEPANAYTCPLIGGMSLLDIMGLAFVLVAGYAVYRKYSNKD